MVNNNQLQNLMFQVLKLEWKCENALQQAAQSKT